MPQNNRMVFHLSRIASLSLMKPAMQSVVSILSVLFSW